MLGHGKKLDVSKYRRFLKSLPERTTYSKTDLLVEETFIESEKTLSVYYSPMDWINTGATVILLGLTPGWQQTEIAYRTARQTLLGGSTWDEACRAAKIQASFAGSMRKHIIHMLDGLGLPEWLHVQSTAELFGPARERLHTSSALRYPVFKASVNYTGSNPSPTRSPLLMAIARNILVPELNSIPNAVIIPMGKAVTAILEALSDEKRLQTKRILTGFPHPSGGNGHRVRQYNENREKMTQQLKTLFS